MKRFNLCAIDTKLSIAIELSNNLLTGPSKLLNNILMKDDWKYNSGDGVSVFSSLIKARPPINIYIAASKKTKAVAYFQNGSIYIYQSYLDSCATGDLVGTILHEYAHYCGFNHNSAFGTSNFKTQSKCLYSVPYYLSENVSKWI